MPSPGVSLADLMVINASFVRGTGRKLTAFEMLERMMLWRLQNSDIDKAVSGRSKDERSGRLCGIVGQPTYVLAHRNARSHDVACICNLDERSAPAVYELLRLR